MGTLNVANASVTTAKIGSLLHTDGVTKHTNYTYVPKVAVSLMTGITWHTSYNGTHQPIADLSGYVDSDTIAVDITCRYVHNGSNNHGYLTGYLYQQGTSHGSTGTWFDRQHFDWYYNVDTMDYRVLWDGSGNTNLTLYVSGAYNSSTSNQYAFYLQGVHKQTS
tara:strand:+ start:125 stop:616 length:492 start_codon:yes stop_codon:yes gene_type:complete